MKPLTKDKIIAILGVLVIGLFFIGFVMGSMFTTYSYIEIIKSIDIEEINIVLNETQVVNAILDRQEIKNIINKNEP